jgi:hypothetical protein
MHGGRTDESCIASAPYFKSRSPSSSLAHRPSSALSFFLRTRSRMCFRVQSIASAGEVFCMATIFRSFFRQHVLGRHTGQGLQLSPGSGVEVARGRSPPERVILSISTLATLFLFHPSNTYNNILHTDTSPLRLNNPTHTSR